MYLEQGCFLLSMWVVIAAYDGLHYNLMVAPLQLELFKIGSDRLNKISFDRLNAIPVVPRPSGFQRPGGFRRPTTTRRPFRKRPTVGAIQLTTPRPQTLPVVRPQTRPPQTLPVVPPQPSSPQVQPTTPRPLPATVPPPLPQLPSETPLEIPSPSETPNSPLLPIVVPNIPPEKPNVVLPETPSTQPQLPSPDQTQIQASVPGSTSPAFVVNVPQAGVPQTSGQVPQTPLFPIVVAETPSFQPETFEPLPSTPYQPTLPGSVNQPLPELPPNQTPAVPSQIQSQAQPPFEGPNLPPNPPTSPTFPSSQVNTGGTRPQAPLVFPVARPPLIVASRPPFRPRPPPAERPPHAQPPFDNGPHVPPKPPPIPATSTTSFGVNTAPPSDKPQRPLPPSRPILQNPLPLPKPPFQLTTTEKPSVIFNESSMDDGNYSFDFLVSNSVYRKEQGFLKKSLIHPGHVIHVKTGAYSFVSPEGTFHRIDFVADEHGYRAFESTY